MRRSRRSGSRRCKPRAMDFASPLISVEKNSVGTGVADGPKKMDGCGVKHEVVAHILMGIRGSMEKDSAGDREARYHPTPPPPTPQNTKNTKKKKTKITTTQINMTKLINMCVCLATHVC